MVTIATSTSYEYMDKAAIDKDLFCDYCNNPLVDPVSTPCKHTFCRMCIQNKFKKTGGTCAKPKCKNRSISLNDLTSVTERIVLNMLDRLLVKCMLCGTINIPRASFEKHVTNFCPKVTVSCTAIDLKCPWIGSNEQLKQHISVCTYEQMRPILTEITQNNHQLKEQIQQMSEQCEKNHLSYIKELQETNQHLNTNIEQLNEVLYHEKVELKDLQLEFQQLKELILQDKTQINELQTEIRCEKEEIIRANERCNKQEIQINQLIDKINAKEDAYAYQNPELELSISKCPSHTTIDLSKQQLLDRDMETIIKQALIEKECTRLDLGYNVITSKGASILADALKHNTTLEELDFHHNRLSDLGVHSLTKVLSSNNSILKALGLGSNGITDNGVEHLAEMLKTNRTITWLALAGNQISDHGVKLLANTLAYQNTSLLVLSLHVNKSISDESVDIIIDMLQHNKSLKKLWIQDCNISEDGKLKLRNVAKIKQGFSLYM
ncbi:unnamed protein product [Rotaria sp. Silwood2]|nr:unnamed protein product [Rotaria sp. Silwood2]CAF2628242.1 unnamed protein product [Rotaria sp. Silwood2]CAF2853403.1 unnamed protein product [Rotaria sp. Silwood2]CAF3000574.1 unnamed protein product [Rotaria sp. Silwood2]CAF3954230.1 unnamed protein product [Rotaria sp. Silwood2]